MVKPRVLSEAFTLLNNLPGTIKPEVGVVVGGRNILPVKFASVLSPVYLSFIQTLIIIYISFHDLFFVFIQNILAVLGKNTLYIGACRQNAVTLPLARSWLVGQAGQSSPDTVVARKVGHGRWMSRVTLRIPGTYSQVWVLGFMQEEFKS